MLKRFLTRTLLEYLNNFPVVALIGPRQVGKTTLALHLRKEMGKASIYLDLEKDSDLRKLKEAELYLTRFNNTLIILDEVQRKPDLFSLLRSLVDERKRKNEPSGHFLILGSASPILLKQSSESLAGRIAYLELNPFNLIEIPSTAIETLWIRGGYPDSFYAKSEAMSLAWRQQFISTYVERDIPQLGSKLPHEQMKRFWSMLAQGQGSLLNAARLASSLGVSGNTVRHYLDVLTDLFMVRQLQPWQKNKTKRLVKAPKIYVRDSGLVHALTNITNAEDLLGNPLCGTSWEGFVIDNILSLLKPEWQPYFYRTSAGAELDLLLEGPRNKRIAIEIKRTLTPSVSKGFRLSCEDVQATHRYFLLPKGEPFPLDSSTEAMGITVFLKQFPYLLKSGSMTRPPFP